MQGVGAALGRDRYLAASAPAEVGGLVCRGNLELLNAFDRDRNNSRGCLVEARTVIVACASAGVRAEALNISVIVATHIVGGKSTVKLESVLVARVTADVAIDVLPRLEDGQGRCVAADVRQVHERLAAAGRPDAGVHGLQLGAGRIGHLDRTGNASDFQSGIYGQLAADFYDLCRNHGGFETWFGDGDVVGARVDGGEHVKPFVARRRVSRARGCRIGQSHRGIRYDGARAVSYCAGNHAGRRRL